MPCRSGGQRGPRRTRIVRRGGHGLGPQPGGRREVDHNRDQPSQARPRAPPDTKAGRRCAATPLILRSVAVVWRRSWSRIGRSFAWPVSDG
jgi:hypothetical protein